MRLQVWLPCLCHALVLVFLPSVCRESSHYQKTYWSTERAAKGIHPRFGRSARCMYSPVCAWVLIPPCQSVSVWAQVLISIPGVKAWTPSPVAKYQAGCHCACSPPWNGGKCTVWPIYRNKIPGAGNWSISVPDPHHGKCWLIDIVNGRASRVVRVIE